MREINWRVDEERERREKGEKIGEANSKWKRMKTHSVLQSSSFKNSFLCIPRFIMIALENGRKEREKEIEEKRRKKRKKKK